MLKNEQNKITEQNYTMMIEIKQPGVDWKPEKNMIDRGLS